MQERRILLSNPDTGELRVGTVFTFGYVGTQMQEITLPSGLYNLQVWGAQGGSSVAYSSGSKFSLSAKAGGRGGYSEGILRLTSDTTLYVFVGGRGSDGSESSNKIGNNHYYWSAANGGDATDIRLVNSYNSNAAMLSRFIVAGGGGGGAQGVYLVPGDGSGTKTYQQSKDPYGGGTTGGGVRAGSQTANGRGGGGFTSIGGIGAHSSTIGSGGYGGGWYTGGKSNDGNISSVSDNGGGSGFVNTQDANRPQNYSGLLLESGTTIKGNSSFPNIYGTGNETGHQGNGYAKITVLQVGMKLNENVFCYSESAVTIDDQNQSLPILTNLLNLSLTFTSSDTSIATVNSSGVVTVVGYGTTTISAIFSGDENYLPKTISYTLTTIDTSTTTVDLGLPSGLLWGTTNIGADLITDYGNFYTYGSGSDTYDLAHYQNPYSGTENPLSNTFDTAYQTLGTEWRTPTESQVAELINNTNYSWTTINGVSGAKFTSLSDSTKYVFFPSSGYYYNNSYTSEGNEGCIWTSTPGTSPKIKYLSIISSGPTIGQVKRSCGFNIRGVKTPS